MSWKNLNEMIGMAAIDQQFCQKLLQSPISAIDEQGYVLTPEEREIVATIRAADIQEFCEQLLALFMHS